MEIKQLQAALVVVATLLAVKALTQILNIKAYIEAGAGGRGNNSSEEDGEYVAMDAMAGNVSKGFGFSGTSGKHSNSASDHSSGGGASAYSGSIGGNGIYHSDGGSGTKGGGGRRRKF